MASDTCCQVMSLESALVEDYKMSQDVMVSGSHVRAFAAFCDLKSK